MQTMIAVRRALVRVGRWPGWLKTLAGTMLAAALPYYALPWCLPLPDALRAEPPESRVVCDRNGVVLRRLLHEGRFRHEQVALRAIPSALVEATLAAEDKRFYRHGGIDLLAVCRAARDNFLRLRTVSGGSTLTQQLIKLASPPRRRTAVAKLREMLLARQLEMRFSKERILETVLNRLDYGGMNLGCGAAARFYFQKPVGELSVSECALLAGLPQAPSRLNPLRHPAAARRRRSVVLGRWAKLEPERAGELLRAGAEPVQIQPVREPAIAQHAILLALDASGDRTRVRTTIDRDLQCEVEAILRGEVDGLAARNVHNAAAIVIDNATGEILALAGSSDFHSLLSGQVNGTLRPRSAGSTLKAFTYLLAFEQGASPGDVIADVPARYPDSGGWFTPENYDRVFHGPLSLREALANSVNAAAVRLLQQVGGAAKLLDTLHRLGFRRLDRGAAQYGLGLTIGNAEVRLLDLANAYACIARMGEYRRWRIVAGATGPEGDGARRLFSEESCFLVADILSDNAARSAAFGSESALRFPFPVGCKTGTSSDFRDNWCMAFTPQFTVGVWMGNHSGRPMQGVSGVTGSATAVHRIVTRLAARRAMTWYARPAGILTVNIDRRTGRTVSRGQVEPKWVREEMVRSGAVPVCARPEDYDSGGNALLADEVFAEWFRGPFNRFPSGIALRSGVHPEFVEPRVLSPVSGMTYLLDPELPNGGRTLPLASNLGAEAEWSSPTLKIERDGKREVAVLAPGRHRIVLKNPRSGATATALIQVERR